MKSKELCTYLEQLRSARNISQENFTADIVSLRQYRRYISGESDVPFQVVHKLASKIGVKTDNLLREFEVAKNEETRKINHLFSLVANYDHEEFVKQAKKIPLSQIIELNNKLLYEYCQLLNMYSMNRLSKQEVGRKNAELIDYPRILKTDVLTSVEMLILTSLLDYVDQIYHEKIIDKVLVFIEDSSTVISGGNEKMYTYSLVRISKFFGIHEEYDNVVKFCNMGVRHNLHAKSYFLMEYFYYYMALSCYRLGRIDQYEDMLAKCFNAIHLEGNQKKIDKFTKLIEDDFKIVLSDFIAEYYKKKRENR